jgi:hypothetical protein
MEENLDGTPRNSLKDSNASPKMKAMKEEQVGVWSLAHSILGIRGVC